MVDEVKPTEAAMASATPEVVKALVDDNTRLLDENAKLRAQLNPQHGAGVVGTARTGGEEYPKWLHDLGITVHSREHEDSVRKPKEEVEATKVA